MKFKENIKYIYEMANVRPNKTGLSMVIWIFPQTGKEKHWARIKVQKKYGEKAINDMFSITISDNPEIIGNQDVGEIKIKDIEKIKNFIKKNKNALLSVWNDEVAPDEIINNFIKV